MFLDDVLSVVISTAVNGWLAISTRGEIEGIVVKCTSFKDKKKKELKITTVNQQERR